MMADQLNETYLGDGLYASFDGFMIRLRAPREEGDHWVALEPDVYQALVAFIMQNTAPHWYRDTQAIARD